MNATDRRIVGMALPALGSLAAEPMYVLVDTAIVGRLGTAQLGGLALAATVLSLVVAGCNFLTYGTTERVARRLGSGRPDDAADVGVQAMWLSVIVGTLLAPVVIVGASAAGRVLGGAGEVLDVAVTYLRIGALGLPFILIALGAQGIQRGAADYRTPLVILLTANAVNAVLEVLFVFGFGWGVAGSALSTVLVQLAAGVAFLLTVRPHLRPATRRRPSYTEMRPLLTAGRHLLVRVGAMLAVTSAMTAVAARTDEPTLAAHQIGVSLFLFIALGLDALAIPAQTLVAEELGHGGSVAAAEIARRCVRLSVIAGATLAAVLVVLSPVLPHAFTADPAVIERTDVRRAVAGADHPARGRRLRLRRGADRSRRLPLPRRRRGRLPRGRQPTRHRRARRRPRHRRDLGDVPRLDVLLRATANLT